MRFKEVPASGRSRLRPETGGTRAAAFYAAASGRRFGGVADRCAEDEDLGGDAVDGHLAEERLDAAPGHRFDAAAEERFDLILEGGAVGADVLEATAVDEQLLGFGEEVFGDADDDLVAPHGLRLGRPTSIEARMDADDFTRDLGNQRAAAICPRPYLGGKVGSFEFVGHSPRLPPA